MAKEWATGASNRARKAVTQASGGSIKIKPSKVGSLHAAVGVPQDQPIPASKEAIQPDDSSALKKKKQFAINAKSWGK